MSGVLPPEVAAAFPYSYAVVDVETTGLKSQADRVVQIAVTQLTADGEIESEWSSLVDPDRDPGPVHIHGITPERLRGAPHYVDIVDRIHQRIDGRVFVAHNARFDWNFLEAEAGRTRSHFPSHQRLCTWQTSALFDLPLPNLKLGTICQYWGVKQARAHDAADDVRSLVEVTRHSLAYASFLHLQLPITRPFPRDDYPPKAPRTPCRWRYPGRHTPGELLAQGMTVVFTGPTALDRALLTQEAIDTGLDVMNSVSSRTSLLVTNGTTTTHKAKKAALHGTSVLDEPDYRRLLSTIRPGIPKAGPAASAAQPKPERGVTKPTMKPAGPLAGHRVIVLGGSPDDGRSMRERIIDNGGACAVNLTASVTAAIALDDYETDRRWERVRDSNVLLLDSTSLAPVEATRSPDVIHTLTTGTPVVTTPVAELPRGGVLDIANVPVIVAVRWSHSAAIGDVDVVAFVLDADDLVEDDADFCFYNQPEHPRGVVQLELDTTGQAVANVSPGELGMTRRLVLAAAIDGEGVFGQLGAIDYVDNPGLSSCVVYACR